MKNTIFLVSLLLAGGVVIIILKSGYKIGDVIEIYIPEEGWSVFTILDETSTQYLLGEGYPGNIIDQNWINKAELKSYQIRKISMQTI